MSPTAGNAEDNEDDFFNAFEKTATSKTTITSAEKPVVKTTTSITTASSLSGKAKISTLGAKKVTGSKLGAKKATTINFAEAESKATQREAQQAEVRLQQEQEEAKRQSEQKPMVKPTSQKATSELSRSVKASSSASTAPVSESDLELMERLGIGRGKFNTASSGASTTASSKKVR